jgi:hypothetical protein
VRLSYRFRQWWKAVFPRVTRADRAWVAALLPPPAYALFLSMSRAGQRHGLDTARQLAGWELHIRSRLSAAEYTDLLQAALLHDCGKTPFHLTVGQRAARVALEATPASLRRSALRRWPFAARALQAAAAHAALGAEMAARCGLSRRVQLLILRHHQPQTPAEKLLAQADDRC